MKAKYLLFIIFLSFHFFAGAQLFQEHDQIAGRHLHGITTEQHTGPSNDLLMEGNFSETTFNNPLIEVVRLDESGSAYVSRKVFVD
ncbi:MAG: hypothetical protein DRJ15_13890 [Bacteroidetes bacterium]|nr:MAG: hypothetical protein DRJ15_13890 [Bacteroidota bacterium]